jgi:hypothetical protein
MYDIENDQDQEVIGWEWKSNRSVQQILEMVLESRATTIEVLSSETSNAKNMALDAHQLCGLLVLHCDPFMPLGIMLVPVVHHS